MQQYEYTGVLFVQSELKYDVARRLVHDILFIYYVNRTYAQK